MIVRIGIGKKQYILKGKTFAGGDCSTSSIKYKYTLLLLAAGGRMQEEEEGGG